MRRTSLLIGIVMVLGTWTAAAAGPADLGASTEVIVGFLDWPGLQAGDSYQGLPVVDANPTLEFAVVEASGVAAVRQAALDDDRVLYVELNHNDWELAFTPNDPRFGDQYGPQITNAQTAWDTTLGSTSVKLGLLDSGITASHEDFVDSRISGHDYFNGDNTPEDSGTCSYHGSHTSGIAAATTDNGVGVAGMSQSSIIMHKIFDGSLIFCSAASTGDIADALMDLGDKGAHISSNSWGGGGSSSTLNNAIDYAHNKGTIHVAAAGNDGSCTDCISEPWVSRPNKVVIVTCSDSGDGFCSFSSQGPETDLIAPGNDVLSVDGGGGYQELSGTSMSAPHVSGAIGLYIAANGDASFSTIETALKDSADDLGLSAERQGGGRLNAGAFVGGSSSTNSPPTSSFTFSCTDLTCDFDASGSSDSDGSISSYDWDFGDGTTGTGETVSHTYDSGGTYTVTLTVTDDDGATDSSSQDVSVSESTTNDPPTSSFTFSCTDLTCDFDGSDSSDSDGSISSYDWDFGDGNTGTGQTVTHTYASGGTYTVTLTVTDDDGATDSSSQDVSVSESTAGGIHSGDLDGAQSNQGSTWTATVTVTVHDADHTAEGGSTVSFDYTGRDVSGSASCTSGSDGTCSVSVSGIPKRTGDVTFSITGISDSDGSYDASSNHDPDGDSDGTTITVNKP